MNIKRAFKTMVKLGCGRIYVQEIEYGKKLVSNGHVIVTVSGEDFEANKEYLKNICETDMKKIALDTLNEENEEIRPTTVSIKCGDTNTRVMKSKNGLGVVNEEYLKVLDDVGCTNIFVVAKPKGEMIKTPLIETVVANGVVYHLNAVLPINCNVRDVLQHVLGF
jgi:hypothetical protein